MTSSKKIIRDYEFSDETPKHLEEDGFFVGWPVVYLINNDEELYIGETYHSEERMKQHLKNPDRRKLTQLHIVGSPYFTKSATLDIESSLIELCRIEKLRTLQNGNDGLVNHDYANKDYFRKDSLFFQQIWQSLKQRGLVKEEIENLLNSDLFKYSPYKSLNYEQCTTRDEILEEINDCFKHNESRSMFVDGSAGTGKTILAIYLLKLLVTDTSYLENNEETEGEILSFVDTLNQIKTKKPDLKVAYVVAMSSLRKTLKNVFKEIKGLSSGMVIAPSDVFNNNYNILIVDEAHRLKQRKNIMEYKSFDKNNAKLNLGKEGTQLDWIVKNSQIQILFYDQEQTVKPTDVNVERFNQLKALSGNSQYKLSSQMRCLAGRDYIKYVKNVLDNNQNEYIDFNNNYEFLLFDDINKFCSAIYEKEKEYGLTRIVAGYGFEWNNKKVIEDLYHKRPAPKEIHQKEIKDINIQNREFYWNRRLDGWPMFIDGLQVVNEVGCIHTIQGYDLNYCGVIFGPEIKYINDKIVIDKDHYFDSKGKIGTSDNELKQFIINIYSVLLTRGIKGTYVYVCDNQLREYLSRFISLYK